MTMIAPTDSRAEPGEPLMLGSDSGIQGKYR